MYMTHHRLNGSLSPVLTVTHIIPMGVSRDFMTFSITALLTIPQPMTTRVPAFLFRTDYIVKPSHATFINDKVALILTRYRVIQKVIPLY